MSYDIGTTMRSCGHPACPRQFDIAAHMAGEVNAGPWMRNRLVSYLCPGHAAGDHVPALAIALAPVDGEPTMRTAQAVAVCSCDWRGQPARNIAGAAEQWRGHVEER